MDFYFWSLSHYKYDWKFKKKKRKEWAEEYQGRPSHFYTQPSRSPFCSVQALAARETMSWRWRTDLPYGVLRTEHMVPDPKHQPPHLWGSTTPIYLSRYGVLGTLCTPYSLHCMYLQQLRTKKWWFAQGVLTSQGMPIYLSTVHALSKAQMGGVHTLYRKDSRKSKQKKTVCTL